MTRIETPSLVVLVGPSASGKSTWAAEHFAPEEVTSTDALRAVVGRGVQDQEASGDAFAIVDRIVAARLGRGLLVVIDSTGLDEEHRHRWLDIARAAGVPTYAVPFRTDRDTCRARNRARDRTVPQKIVDSQHRRCGELFDRLVDEGFVVVEPDADLRAVPPGFVEHPTPGPEVVARDPGRIAFGLQIPDYGAVGDRAELRTRLADIARAAEDAGFESLWVMDHLVQIPFVGRPWLDLLESYTTLAYLAGVTETIRLGTMVTGITFRNVAHLAKIIATLDVVSGGRAEAGLGAAWFAHEHQAYGYEFPDAAVRLDLLEDALQLLPALWGPGAKPFTGKVLDLPETTCYPRPLQEHIPLLVGGEGEQRTLRLVARYADACNLRGDLDSVRHKIEVLRRHCADVDRDPDDIRISHLGTALVGDDPAHVRHLVDDHRGNRAGPAYAAFANAATVDDHVERFERFTDAGVRLFVVSLPDVSAASVRRFGQIVDRLAR